MAMQDKFAQMMKTQDAARMLEGVKKGKTPKGWSPVDFGKPVNSKFAEAMRSAQGNASGEYAARDALNKLPASLNNQLNANLYNVIKDKKGKDRKRFLSNNPGARAAWKLFKDK